MPYKSNAQRRKFHALLAEHKISEEVVEEFDKKSKGLVLPEKKRLLDDEPKHKLRRKKK